MKFGYFDDAAREYVIETPKTPLPWINYLGSESFFSLISNTAGGYSFYKDAKLRRLTRYRYNNIPTDQGGRYYYIKDGDAVWNPGWQPSKTPLDSYKCRHGLGYTIIEGSFNGVFAKLACMVPIGDDCELNRLTIHNMSGNEKRLDVFSFMEFCLWDTIDDSANFQRNFSIGEVEIEGSDIYHKTEYRERRNHFAVFSVNSEINGFDTDRDAFLGAYGGIAAPETVITGKSTQSVASGWAPVASHHLKIVLAPGESKSLIFVLAYVENPVDEKWEAPGVAGKTRARALLSKYRADDAFDTAALRLREHWDDILSSFTVDSSEKKVDRMVNIWNQYQCMITFNLSRSASYFESGTGRGMGFRDSCQDILGFTHMAPERARGRILDIAATQHEDGSCYHQYQPLTKRGNTDIGGNFNDDPLWLIAAVDAYVRETGDLSILSEKVPFDNDPTLAKPLLSHLKRSFDFTLANLGPHGLPLIGRADWNDCLNLNCFSTEPGESFQTASSIPESKQRVAESVFIAGMFALYGGRYAELTKFLGDDAEAERASGAVKAMYSRVVESGWDGDWFLRAYDAFGKPVGSHVNDEGQIFIEPQGMCALAGIGVKEKLAVKALDSVARKLDTEYGVMLLQPAFTYYRPEYGEITSYPPGYKENAGIFCHNNPWIVCAEASIGRDIRAYEVYKKTCPAFFEEISEIHRTEPYAYCQMIAGKDAPRFGEGKNSWLTGAAAWNLVSITQYILGVKPTLRGLSIEPCPPPELSDYTVTRRYRGAEYRIHVKRDGDGRNIRIAADGKKIEGSLIPPAPIGSVCKVEAIIY